MPTEHLNSSKKSVKRFERSNGLDTALNKNYLYPFLSKEMSKYDPLALRRSYTIALFDRMSNTLRLYGPLIVRVAQGAYLEIE